MKALLLLADGFELTEAMTTFDVLRRTHEIDVTLASISNKKEVTCNHGVTLIADALLGEIETEPYDFLILPGGKLGVDNLSGSDLVISTIKRFADTEKDIHAICAAPSILGRLGLLDGIDYTCFPGFQRGEGRYLDVGAVSAERHITGHSMGYTMEFAFAIVRKYLGEEAINRISTGIYGRN